MPNRFYGDLTPPHGRILILIHIHNRFLIWVATICRIWQFAHWLLVQTFWDNPYLFDWLNLQGFNHPRNGWCQKVELVSFSGDAYPSCFLHHNLQAFVVLIAQHLDLIHDLSFVHRYIRSFTAQQIWLVLRVRCFQGYARGVLLSNYLMKLLDEAPNVLFMHRLNPVKDVLSCLSCFSQVAVSHILAN